jgi:hypothetical protein
MDSAIDVTGSVASSLEPKSIAREQADKFPDQRLPLPDEKVREVATRLGLPTLEAASITKWQFDPAFPRRVHYMITFPESPKLWSISYPTKERADLEQMINCEPWKVTPNFNKGKSLVVSLIFPLSFDCFEQKEISKDGFVQKEISKDDFVHCCLISNMSIFKEIPQRSLLTEGKTHAVQELLLLLTALRDKKSELVEIHKQNLKHFLDALSHASSLRKGDQPLFTKEAFIPFAQVFKFNQEELNFYHGKKLIPKDLMFMPLSDKKLVELLSSSPLFRSSLKVSALWIVVGLVAALGIGYALSRIPKVRQWTAQLSWIGDTHG